MYAQITDATITTTAGGRVIKTWGNGGSSTTATSATTTAINWVNPTLGSINGTTRVFDGEVAEVIMYDTVLSLADINRVGSYLADRWGVTWTTAT